MPELISIEYAGVEDVPALEVGDVLFVFFPGSADKAAGLRVMAAEAEEPEEGPLAGVNITPEAADILLDAGILVSEDFEGSGEEGRILVSDAEELVDAVAEGEDAEAEEAE